MSIVGLIGFRPCPCLSLTCAQRNYENSYDRFSKRLQADPPTTTTTIYERVHVDAAAVTATGNATVDVAVAVAETAAAVATAVAFTRKSLLSHRTAQTWQVMHINDGIKYN